MKKIITASVLVLASVVLVTPAHAAQTDALPASPVSRLGNTDGPSKSTGSPTAPGKSTGSTTVPSKSTGSPTVPSKSPGGAIPLRPKSIAGALNSGTQALAANAFIGIKDKLVQIEGYAEENFPDDFILVAMAKEYACGVKRHFDLVDPKNPRCL
ncbi:hypothetical protein ABZW47_13525 [Streptomyces sp. NPDC004549]|uniref:hypothetical protein n=1 Tax=Streptomyces sp. NPDC004549 TaxID=3154283 RepID=UPI0033B58A38